MDSNENATGDTQQAGGFVNLADGSFAVDPRATMSQDLATHLWRTSAAPQLLGMGEQTRGRITYSWQLQRWLPVAWNQISPDGLTYTYVAGVYPKSTAGQGEVFPSSIAIHVVDPRSGSDRVVFSTDRPPFYYNVVSFLGPVIYLSQVCPSGCGPESLKLWRLDVHTGVLTKVSDRQGFLWAIDRGTAWVATFANNGRSSQLIRVDLATGRETVWLTAPGLQLIGVDGQGAPLLDVDVSVLVRVTGPQRTELVFPGNFYIAVTDGARTWLGEGSSTNEGIYLLSPDAGIQKVSDFKGLPLGGVSQVP